MTAAFAAVIMYVTVRLIPPVVGEYALVEGEVGGTLGAVSYTHLDVYKRQQYRMPMNRQAYVPCLMRSYLPAPRFWPVKFVEMCIRDRFPGLRRSCCQSQREPGCRWSWRHRRPWPEPSSQMCIRDRMPVARRSSVSMAKPFLMD